MKLRHRIGSLVLTLIMFFSMGVITHAANYKLNVAVVGEPGVGKTTLIEGLCAQGENIEKRGECTRMNHYYEPDKRDFDINFYDIDMDLETMEASPDTHKYSDLLSKCHYALIVFDLSEGDTLAKGRIQRWKEVAKDRMPLCDIIFVPNKIDLITSKEELQKLGMPIARYAGQCEREFKYPGALQDFSCLPVSEKNIEKHIQIINHICEWGGIRIRDFENRFGRKKTPNNEIEPVAPPVLINSNVIDIHTNPYMDIPTEIPTEVTKNQFTEPEIFYPNYDKMPEKISEFEPESPESVARRLLSSDRVVKMTMQLIKKAQEKGYSEKEIEELIVKKLTPGWFSL